jgi:hypothetical protein
VSKASVVKDRESDMRALTVEELGFVAGGFAALSSPNVDGGGGIDLGSSVDFFGPFPTRPPMPLSCDEACRRQREIEYEMRVAQWQAEQARDRNLQEQRMQQLVNDAQADCTRRGGNFVIQTTRPSGSLSFNFGPRGGGGSVSGNGGSTTQSCTNARD